MTNIPSLLSVAKRFAFVFLYINCQLHLAWGQPAVTQLPALLDLEISWNGNNALSSWTVTNPCNAWYGLTCDNNNFVIGINIASTALNGSIPKSIGSLESLLVLNVTNCGLTGSIPDSVGSLTSLQLLHLGFNQLSGPLPSSLGNLVNLRDMNLFVNALTGSLPSTLGALAHLTILDLRENLFAGTIPSSFANLTSLQLLALNYNRLSGPVPTSLSKLNDLTILYLNGNALSGEIPSSLGSLLNLRELYLDYNLFTGPIPPTFGSLANLQLLSVGFNNLSGPLPPSLGNLVALRQLGVYGNQLTGSIPSSLGGLTSVNLLSLGGNQFSGLIPPSLGRLTNLQHFNLNDNQLTGTVPSTFGALKGLQNGMYVYNNFLSGTLSTYPFILHADNNCFSTLNGQRSPADCAAFCGCNSVSGMCSGFGICSNYTSAGPVCACNEGYVPGTKPGTCVQSENVLDSCFSFPDNNRTLRNLARTSSTHWTFARQGRIGIDRLFRHEKDVIPPPGCNYVANVKKGTVAGLSLTLMEQEVSVKTKKRYHLKFFMGGARGVRGNCFSNVATKIVTVVISDNAGNQSKWETFQYTVTPNTPLGDYKLYGIKYRPRAASVTVQFFPLYDAADHCGALISNVVLK